jgi:hypothetical protein
LVPDVILDGEKVIFEGAPPATLGELRVALETSLASAGRVLATLLVNGHPFAEAQMDQPFAGAGAITAGSLVLTDALKQVGAALVPEFVALQREADELACAVLREPWDEIQGRCGQLIGSVAEVMHRAVDVAALAGEGSATASGLSALAQAVEGCMTAIQQRDAAGVCLQLDGAVLAALAQLEGALRGEDTA